MPGIFGGGGPQYQNTGSTTTTAKPWKEAQPHLVFAMNRARQMYENDEGYKPWTGPMQADVNPVLARSFSQIGQLAANSKLPGQAADFASDILGGSETRAGGTNPFMRRMLNDNAERIGNQTSSAMSGMGRYGSFEHGAEQAKAIAQANNPLLAQTYENAMGRQMQMAAMAPTINELQYSGANKLGAIGGYLQNRQQVEHQGNIDQWNAQQARPWEQLSRYTGIVGGMGGLGGTKVSTSAVPQPPMWQSALGGAMMGGGLGSMFGPWGTGAGIVGGGLLGAFG